MKMGRFVLVIGLSQTVFERGLLEEVVDEKNAIPKNALETKEIIIID